MCGIVGYTGGRQAAPIILDGLGKLEYRGYDSAGIAVSGARGQIDIVKAKGKLKVLDTLTEGGKRLDGLCTANLPKTTPTPIAIPKRRLSPCTTA